MKLNASLAMAALASALLAGSPARAATLLNLVDEADQVAAPYSLSFTAGGPHTAISIGGYQVLDFELVENIGLFLNGAGPNLLGPAWSLTPASPLNTDTFTYDDGTSVPALAFASTGAGSYDTYAQTIATTAGQSYSLNFLYTNDYYGGGSAPSGLQVTESAVAGAPEPSAWALMLLGFGGLGVLGYRRKAERSASSVPA